MISSLEVNSPYSAPTDYESSPFINRDDFSIIPTVVPMSAEGSVDSAFAKEVAMKDATMAGAVPPLASTVAPHTVSVSSIYIIVLLHSLLILQVLTMYPFVLYSVPSVFLIFSSRAMRM